jgi:hypothetical protein
VTQKSSPAVRRAEGGCRSTGVFGIYELRSHRDEARRVRDDLDKVVGGERGPGLVARLAYGERAHMGPKITGPGSSDVGAPLVRHRVSVAALRSPVGTGRAISGRRGSSSAPAPPLLPQHLHLSLSNFSTLSWRPSSDA